MRTITFEEANSDMLSTINYSLETHEEINIATSKGAVVIIPQDDYESMQETLRLLQDTKSLKALLDSHTNRDNKIKNESYNIKDVFSDLQN